MKKIFFLFVVSLSLPSFTLGEAIITRELIQGSSITITIDPKISGSQEITLVRDDSNLHTGLKLLLSVELLPAQLNCFLPTSENSEVIIGSEQTPKFISQTIYFTRNEEAISLPNFVSSSDSMKILIETEMPITFTISFLSSKKLRNASQTNKLNNSEGAESDELTHLDLTLLIVGGVIGGLAVSKLAIFLYRRCQKRIKSRNGVPEIIFEEQSSQKVEIRGVEMITDEKIAIIEGMEINLTDEFPCIVCMQHKKIVKLKPCNHICSCMRCTKKMLSISENCPYCRRKVEMIELDGL